MDEKLYKVTENEINQRLDIYIASLNLDISRSNAQKKNKTAGDFSKWNASKRFV